MGAVSGFNAFCIIRRPRNSKSFSNWNNDKKRHTRIKNTHKYNCTCVCTHVYMTEYMRYYSAMPTSNLRAINVIHIFYFGKSTTFWWFYNVFLALQHFLSWSSNRHQTLSSYLYHGTQIALSLSGHGIKNHIQVPNKERIFLFTTLPKLAQGTTQPYAQNDADKTPPPSLIKSLYQSMRLCTASKPVCTTSMKPLTHLCPASYSVCTRVGSW